MTDSSGTVAWAADYKPFGEATVTVSTITNNLRFPGQYFDAETGLNYNYFRDYNPVIGRYIQTDPIGQEGGLNPFEYVFNNPLNYIDIYGEQGFPNSQTLHRIGTSAIQPAAVITIFNQQHIVRGWLGQLLIRFGARRQNTACNFGVQNILSAAGNNNYMGQANAMINQLINNNVPTLTPELAVYYAQQGSIVIAGAPDSPNGHVAVVAPLNMTYSPTWGVNVPYVYNTNLGGRNVGVIPASQGFNSSNQPTYYLLK